MHKENTQSIDDNKSNIIAFQGIEGAYSHEACIAIEKKMTPCGFSSFEDVFQAVESKKAERAMIPIENSLGGRVADIHHLLPETTLCVVNEYFHPVKHRLFGVKGAKLSDVDTVISHPQALAQCRANLKSLNIKAQAYGDTAGAAKEIASKGDITIGALASEVAGKLYNLETLRTDMEDKIGNTTRFIIMSRFRQDPEPELDDCITSFFFVMRSIPAALYKCMGGFATNGVNCIKLESYINFLNPELSSFYAEIEGHPDHKNVKYAFEELHYYSSSIKILGVYRKHPFRNQI